MKEIQLLCGLFLSVCTLLYAYMSVFAVIGFFTAKRFPKAKHLHRYAIVIAARNEQAVIANLLESIHRQHYPQSLITVFVVADNCTDNTAAIARRHGAVCYERTDYAHRTKGFALQYLFRCIQKDYGIDAFEGYFVFDADNTLKEDYLEKMNDAFDSGEKIITSYRNTRNFNDGCISASYAIHYLRAIRMEHRARSVLGLATRITGTGFLFANELVRDGWNFTSLTEDRAFCADAALHGYSISYQHEALFYDEQPTDFHVAMRQRIRWAKGHLLAFGEYGPALFKKLLSSHGKMRFLLYDMLLVVFPYNFVSLLLSGISTAAGLLSFLFFSQGLKLSDSLSLLSSAAVSLFLAWLRQTAMAAYLLFIERKNLEPVSLLRRIWYCMTFCLFDWMGSIATCIAAVTNVEWTPTPHRGLSRQKPSFFQTRA